MCYTLDHLFHRSGFAESMVFKGGTSLVEGFRAHRALLGGHRPHTRLATPGYGEDEPWEPRSNSAQERFRADSIERANAFLADAFVPKLRATLSESLGTEASVRCGAEEETVYFDYPRSYESAGHARHHQAGDRTHGGMVALRGGGDSPVRGGRGSVRARAVDHGAHRESRAHVLGEGHHTAQEANRPEGKAMPRRYSRHYYDMYRLGHSFVLGRAVAQPGLLEQVVRFKEKFYRTPWAKLADARPGTLRLAPPKGRLDELAADYASMRPMLFGSYPSIDEIVTYMVELEETINGLS